MSNVNDGLAELLAEMKAYGEANHVPIININGLAVLEKAVAVKKPQYCPLAASINTISKEPVSF